MSKVGSITRIRVRTNAKVNLFLRVLGRLPDGFHEIESIFHTATLGDDIDIEQLADADRIEVSMDFDGIVGEAPETEQNLAYVAAQRLRERMGDERGWRIAIRKRIPVGAGLGGGSGNAAGVLVALNELLDAGIDRQTLDAIARDIGSDVPYCLLGGTALVTGRGENLTALPSPDSLHLVLAMSDEPLLTRDVYAKWDELDAPGSSASAPMGMALASGDASEIAAFLHNDLEAAAFALRPELRDGKELLVEAGALGAAMTGSGPTLFGIAESEEHANEIAARVEGHFARVVPVSSAVACVERLD
ncbi:MAG TPA: 4-(cytidine 5'-diphospho)-2-C-methyl-D-erythritol kinase [Actinomycetota bacterium]|nr:4-(cytidine 5'-diphospho)-2-C-methyl-D-erythritol kinase [Actinomycetota bacterium]